MKFSDDEFLEGRFEDSELVIGLVGAVGTEKKLVIDIVTERLKAYKYTTKVISISREIIPQLFDDISTSTLSEYERIKLLIEKGNAAREKSKDNAILALGVASEIMESREVEDESTKPNKKTAYIVDSLKHPKEVERLREIYTNGFFLIGIYSDVNRRCRNLTSNEKMTESEAKELISRDMDEVHGHGQHTRDTFQMSDFFIQLDFDKDAATSAIHRILDLLFGSPTITPTFDEFAMFMAFTSSLRSADLSRQVGAVLAKDNEILASGANDCPKFGGGLYWPEYNKQKHMYEDKELGRDYTRGEDSNKIEQFKIIDDIIQCLDLGATERDKLLKDSKIRDITEYGRVVHAEMETILMCARNNISARGATLYCTTFPCHNCAKHIIAAGIERVYYVEPYPKSKAFDFHSDAITSEPQDGDKKLVEFLPFVGIGPRKFFELFSISLSSGYNINRKTSDGKAIDWKPTGGKLRNQMVPYSYLDREAIATKKFNVKRGHCNEKATY